jgi:hypothetical protein
VRSGTQHDFLLFDIKFELKGRVCMYGGTWRNFKEDQEEETLGKKSTMKVIERESVTSNSFSFWLVCPWFKVSNVLSHGDSCCFQNQTEEFLGMFMQGDREKFTQQMIRATYSLDLTLTYIKHMLLYMYFVKFLSPLFVRIMTQW